GNGSNSAEDKKSLNLEVKKLQTELNRIADTTSFGTKKLLNGNVEGAANPPEAADNKVTFQVGAYGGTGDTIEIVFGGKMDAAILEVSATEVALEKIGAATGALTVADMLESIDAAIETIDTQRATFGAVQNRFDNTIANLHNIQEN